MIHKTKRSKTYRYCVSLKTILNTIFLLILIVFGFCFFAIYADLTVKEILIGCFVILLFYSIPFFAVFLMAKEGFLIVFLHNDCIESRLFNKVICSYSLNDIKYIRIVKSFDREFGVTSLYIVLSKDEIIPRKNLAWSFNMKSEIVIHLTHRNIDNLMNYFSLMGIEPLYNNNFNVLNDVVFEIGDISLKKLSDNKWEKEIRNSGE